MRAQVFTPQALVVLRSFNIIVVELVKQLACCIWGI
jgi:hypothetical protein